MISIIIEIIGRLSADKQKKCSNPIELEHKKPSFRLYLSYQF